MLCVFQKADARVLAKRSYGYSHWKEAGLVLQLQVAKHVPTGGTALQLSVHYIATYTLRSNYSLLPT